MAINQGCQLRAKDDSFAFVSWKFLKLLLPFAVALPLGLALGRLDSGGPSVAGPIMAAAPERLERVKREPLDLQELLRDFAAEQQAWDQREVDPMVDLIKDWTEEELKSALEEALTLPRCLTRMGGERRLPWVLIGTWVKKNPDAVAAWIEGVRSADMKEELVREALRNWPEERAMEGIEFLLKHHWKPGKTYHTEIIPRALEDRAREGAEAMIGLLGRLAEAKVDIGVESLDFPAEFNFAELVGSDGFRAHDKENFQDVVFSEWQDNQPREMLAWMEETREWKRFNDLLDPLRPAGHAAAARFWDETDPELRETVLEAIQWPDLRIEHIRKFIEATTDPEGQDRLITNGLANGLNRYGKLDPIEMLELIPSAERRLNILLQLHPHTDWRPQSQPAANDPPAAAAVRAAIGRWGISVPPPVVEPDPFADP